jgi:hypothetical protein
MKRLFSILAIVMLVACQQSKTEEEFYNPPADGFNLNESDVKAIALADSVMHAMGGRKAWDNTRFISWNFFGRRDLVWDKFTGDTRIEIPADSIVFLVNVNQNTGRVSIRGKELLDQDSLNGFIERAKQIWVNDSYWLVMPYKLKDSGVTLKYIGEQVLESGINCEVIELSFEEVGFTPNNKYRVFIDTQDYLIKQWAFYQDANQQEPSAVWPWDNYQKYGNILLSADRSDGRGPKNVTVSNEMDESVFSNF